jgi:hypothetical protein
MPQRPIITASLARNGSTYGSHQPVRSPTLHHPVMLPGMDDGVLLSAGLYHFLCTVLQRGIVHHTLRAKSLFAKRPFWSAARRREKKACNAHTSIVAKPVSCFFKIAMICSSLKLLRFIVPRFLRVGLYQKTVAFLGRTSRIANLFLTTSLLLYGTFLPTKGFDALKFSIEPEEKTG